MADTILTIDQLNRIFQHLAITMLGLPEPSAQDKTSYAKVRVDWPTKGQPAWAMGEDVAFIAITPADDQAAGSLHDMAFDDGDTEISYLQRFLVAWTFYGPASFAHAQLVRDALVSDQVTHDTLILQNLAVEPDIPSPRRVPELFQGQWWERADLRAFCSEQIVRRPVVAPFASATVTIVTDQGITETVEIEEEES